MTPLDFNPENTHNPLKENAKRAQVSIYILWGIVGISLVALLSSYLQHNLLTAIEEGEFISDQEAEFNDLRQGIIAVVQILFSIASIIAFLYWFRRAYGNLHRLENVAPEHTETWAIWGFIVPIISLWYPYKIMCEIWDKSQRAIKEINSEYKIDYSAAPIGVWWGAYLITNIAGRINFNLSMKAETVDELINVTEMQMICDAIEIPAALITLFVIMRVAKKEKELYDTMNTLPIYLAPEKTIIGKEPDSTNLL